MPNPGQHRLRLRHLLRRGVNDANDQRTLAVIIYLVQLLMSVAAATIISQALASALDRSPMLDRAVDGDLLALIMVVREHATLFATFVWIGIATAAAYAIVSWYLIGGLISVFVERPVTWRQRVERFGAGGASLFLPYLRLALLSLLPYAIVVVVLFIGLGRATDDLQSVMDMGDLIQRIVVNMLPGMLLYGIATTATNYARIDLARHRGSSTRALLRAYRTVFTSPLPVAHAAVYWAYFAGVSAIYVMIAMRFGWHGALGAVALVVFRQLVSVCRFGGKLVLIAGQVELSPRR